MLSTSSTFDYVVTLRRSFKLTAQTKCRWRESEVTSTFRKDSCTTRVLNIFFRLARFQDVLVEKIIVFMTGNFNIFQCYAFAIWFLLVKKDYITLIEFVSPLHKMCRKNELFWFIHQKIYKMCRILANRIDTIPKSYRCYCITLQPTFIECLSSDVIRIVLDTFVTSFWQYPQDFSTFLNSSKHEPEQNWRASRPKRTAYLPILVCGTAFSHWAYWQNEPFFFWYRS